MSVSLFFFFFNHFFILVKLHFKDSIEEGKKSQEGYLTIWGLSGQAKESQEFFNFCFLYLVVWMIGLTSHQFWGGARWGERGGKEVEGREEGEVGMGGILWGFIIVRARQPAAGFQIHWRKSFTAFGFLQIHCGTLFMTESFVHSYF